MKKDKILIITSKEDTHADYVIEKANNDKEIVRLNTEDFASNCIVDYNLDTLSVHILDSDIKFQSNVIKSVWFRRPKDIVVQNYSDDGIVTFINKQYNAFLRGLYFCTHDSAKWINPLPALHRSRIKLQQLQLAYKLGMKVPDTIVTNDPKLVIDFFRKNSTICTKSLDEPNFTIDGYLYPMLTRKIESIEELEEKKESLSICPHLFQEYIDKKMDIRVIIFEKDIFAFEIHSQTNEYSITDFRGVHPEKLKHKKHVLPKGIKEKILKFVSQQGLVYSAIDLVVTEKDKYYFLENNPNGQWLWLELQTGFSLSNELISLLAA